MSKLAEMFHISGQTADFHGASALRIVSKSVLPSLKARSTNCEITAELRR